MIIIHWDFTDGTEISYIEGENKKDNFTTHCLHFFCFGNLAEAREQMGMTPNPEHVSVDDIIVMCKNGDYISAKELLHNEGSYTMKHMRYAHNIHKMLVADSFTFRKGPCIAVALENGTNKMAKHMADDIDAGAIEFIKRMVAKEEL